MEKMPVVILISGEGTNLQNMIDTAASDISELLPIKIAAVISNEPDAFGPKRAKKAGVPTHIVSHKDYPNRETFETELRNQIDQYDPGLVVLAGFMRKLGPEFVNHYKGRMINVHPSLLPKYPGLDTHRRVLEAGEKEHGATVHYVTDVLDQGPIICQSRLTINPEDTEDTLKQRVQQLEYHIYPQVLLWIASGRLKLEDGQVLFDGQAVPKTGIDISPP